MSKSKAHSRAEAFKKYFHSNTDAQEKELIQSEIEMDAFEKEALEGFNTLENSKQVLAAMQAIESKISERTGLERESKIQFPLWRSLGIAASVLLIALGAFTLSKFVERKENQLAVNTETSSEGIEVLAEEELVDFEEDSSLSDLSSNESEVEQEALVSSKTDILKPSEEKLNKEQKMVSTVVSSPSLADEMLMEDTKELTLNFSNDASVQESDNGGYKWNDQEERSSSTSSTTFKQELSSPAMVNTISNDFELAKAKYSAGDFNSAIPLFEKAASNSEFKNESNFYIGMSNFNLGRSNKAIKAFDAVIASSSPLKNNSKWFKSILLLDKGQSNEAKNLLNELANGSSTFKQQAIDKLKSLD
ncbi:MAG: tetratricopeptide repeat protein [Chitinophagales bacterium]